MAKYHVNDQGNVGLCRASKRPCPVSPLAEHFSDKVEAQKFAESKLSEEFSIGLKLSTPKTFVSVNQTRRLAEEIPVDLDEHKQKSQEMLNGITAVQNIALAGYGGFAAGVVNSHLLGNEYFPYDKAPNWRESSGPTDFHSQEELDDYIEVLDSVFEKREASERILYRGIPIYRELRNEMESLIGEKFKPHETEKLKRGLEKYFAIGKVFEYPTFLSTSQDPAIAAERTDNSDGTGESYYDPTPAIRGIQLELKTNAGVDITGVVRSQYAREREVVLPRNMKFEVSSISIAPAEYKTASGDKTKSFQGIGIVVQMVEVVSPR